jgi:hypothetical protein
VVCERMPGNRLARLARAELPPERGGLTLHRSPLDVSVGGAVTSRGAYSQSLAVLGRPRTLDVLLLQRFRGITFAIGCSAVFTFRDLRQTRCAEQAPVTGVRSRGIMRR